MARYKDVDSGMKLLAVDLSRQLLPGTFEHALNLLIEHDLDLSHFDAHYNNDLRGSRAYPPAVLLKVVLFAYSQGIVSSRSIERACRDHVTFMALSGDSALHFTTSADFVSGREQDIVQVFAAVLAICLRGWLVAHADRGVPSGSIRKSNRTDSESAKMAISKGVIQGYTGVAAVDARHQVIVEAQAQAHGTGSEQELLLPVVQGMKEVLTHNSLLTADAGYHSEKNLQALEAQGMEALIADNDLRRRDERFAAQSRHQQGPDPLHDKSPKYDKPTLFTTRDFTYDPQSRTCICPAGKQLQRSGAHRDQKGYIGDRFRGSDSACLQCPLRTQCLRHPDKPAGRQVTFIHGKSPDAPESATQRMKRKIDTAEGRRRYGRRFATVEPVFANIRHNKRLNRFTLRGRRKVDTQWKLYCLVHNIEKLMHYGTIGQAA